MEDPWGEDPRGGPGGGWGTEEYRNQAFIPSTKYRSTIYTAMCNISINDDGAMIATLSSTLTSLKFKTAFNALLDALTGAHRNLEGTERKVAIFRAKLSWNINERLGHPMGPSLEAR